MTKWLLAAIILLGLTLRIFFLSTHPAGFTPDEASFGYDAYSILKTGKDQWGNALPLVFKSFGDDKLPVYTYLTIPSVAIFGLNEFSVRLPNVIFATLAILIVYFLVKELFKDEKLALLSSLLLAISPWHIMLSRGAFEANLTTFFLPLGILFFLKSLKNRNFLILSFVIFLINIFTYHTARLLTPLILLSLIFIYKDKLKAEKLLNLSSFLTVLIIIISAAGFLFAGSRVASSSIFSLNFADDRYLAQLVGEPSIISKLFYNNPLYVTRQFITNYLSYFSPQFLFTSGPAEGTYGMVPGVGTIYLAEIILLAGFIAKAIRRHSKEIIFLLFWILISPIPAALTKGPGLAANRAAFVIPSIQIILALGGIYLYDLLKTKSLKKYFLLGYTLLLFFNFIYVAEKYWVGQTVNQSSSMLYGVSQMINYVKDQNKQIIISKSVSEPQIYFAFYSQINPNIYQNSAKNWSLVNGWVDQQGQYRLANYIFRDLNFSVDAKLPNTILVGKPNDFPSDIKPDKVVNYPDLKPAYYIITTK